jgi:hypothetical protein
VTRRITVPLGALLVSLFVLAGCGGGIQSGTVYAKRDVPAHSETGMHQVYTGEDCWYNAALKMTECDPHYTWVPYTYLVPEEFILSIRACKTDDHGVRKCETNNVDVGSATYEGTRIGAYYDGKAG